MITNSTIDIDKSANKLFKYNDIDLTKYNLNSEGYKDCNKYGNNKIIPIPCSHTFNNLYINYFSDYIKTNYKSSRFNFTRIGIIGIDRIKLYVKLKGIDQEKCAAKIKQILNKDVYEHPKQIIDIKTGEVIGIWDFDYFDSIENVYKNGKRVLRYGLQINTKCNAKDFILDINPPLALYRYPNEYNLTLQELQILLNDIKEELESNGIYISYDNSKIFYLELNKNIIAEEPLYKKHTTLQYLKSHIFSEKATLEPHVQKENVNSQTFTIKDSRTKITLYDKSAQLHNVYNLDLNKERLYLNYNKKIYRLEVTLRNIESISRYFNTNSLNTLLNMNDLIETKFYNVINKKLLKEIKSYFNNQYSNLSNMIDKASLKLVKEIYSNNNASIFDIAILGKAMFEKYKEFGQETNFAKAFKTFLIDCVDESKVNNLKKLAPLMALVNPNTEKLIYIPANIDKQIDKFYQGKVAV